MRSKTGRTHTDGRLAARSTVLRRDFDEAIRIDLKRSEETGLVSRDRCVPWNNHSEYIALHRDTKGEWSNIKQQQVLRLLGCLTGENRSLDGSSIGNSLIRVDGFVELTVSEVFRDERLNFRNPRRAPDKNDIIDFLTRDLRVFQHFLDGLESRLEENCVDLLETCTGDICGEVFSLDRGVTPHNRGNGLFDSPGKESQPRQSSE